VDDLTHAFLSLGFLLSRVTIPIVTI
jgi:hypothetical protein